MRKCAPQWPFRTREMVPTHPTRCVLPWSNLDPRWSAILEPPGQLMATRGPFMAIWAVFGHKMGKNGWIKSMSIWIKTLLNPMDQIHSLVFTKRQLWNPPLVNFNRSKTLFRTPVHSLLNVISLFRSQSTQVQVVYIGEKSAMSSFLMRVAVRPVIVAVLASVPWGWF